MEADSAPTPRKRAAAAGPKKRGQPAPRPASTPDRLDALVKAAVTSLEDDKAEDVVVLDVATRSAFADRMIIATGLAERQIEAMARHVEEALAEHGIRRLRTEASPDWVLLDAGDLVIHLFKPEARFNYALERMWGPESPAPEDSTMPQPRGVDEVEEAGDLDMADDAADLDDEDEDGAAMDGDLVDESEDEDNEEDALPADEILDGPAGTTLGSEAEEDQD
ncbi:ribosome silencing factor [Roseomonas sp. SSH11]|uniref:Ribosomal silencing factor RsfS n=1 Tax=Pararoseomonas baculiformis TaxID=2820812 RepID=A0ABS4AJQ5_9PROT|nr:ribosome silencing factor [Pararoseomonas baculiformis]